MTSADPDILPPAAAAAPPMVRVLLVEDDEDDVFLTRQLLADVGRSGHARFDVEWAADYDRGLGRACSGEHDVCLVDYRLGPHDGVEFIRETVRRDCRVPVILLTGMGDHAVDVAAMNAGAADFLSKTDLTAAVLERSIRYSIQQQRAEDQRTRLLMEQAARAQAEAANRAKDDFLAALSHELRTPLTPVLMAVESLEGEADVPPPVRDTIGLIKRNVELEARLIDDLLDLTRVTHRKLTLRQETVDVHDELRHAALTCGLSPGVNHLPDKRLELVLDTTTPPHHVQGDPARLQQVFWNLIKNAIKFTPDGGRIVVRTANEGGRSGGVMESRSDGVRGADASIGPSSPPSTPPLRHSATPPLPDSRRPATLVIEVHDTGVGIPPDALPRIFNAFEQGGQHVTRQFGGLGLGLAICKALVELHGGTIAADSPGPGWGATFTVRLPACPAPVPSHAPGADPPAATAKLIPRTPTGRILLVEDHPDTRRMMSVLLTRQGYTVSAAGTVGGALDLARTAAEGGAGFDLVISDIGLPDGTGLDLMRQLRDQPHTRSLKGIALSGFGMEHDVQRSEQSGFAAHLTKPINVPQLAEAVGRLLATGGAHE